MIKGEAIGQGVGRYKDGRPNDSEGGLVGETDSGAVWLKNATCPINSEMVFYCKRKHG